MDRAVVGVVLWQVVPAAAALLAVDDRLQHTTRIGAFSPQSPWRVVGLQQRAGFLPVLIRQPSDRCPLVDLVRHEGTSSWSLFALASPPCPLGWLWQGSSYHAISSRSDPPRSAALDSRSQ